MSFRVGQKVICVVSDDGAEEIHGRPLIVRKGEIYTVSATFISHGYPTILLYELPRPQNASGWCEFLFRPLTDISIFTAMLNPSRKKERA